MSESNELNKTTCGAHCPACPSRWSGTCQLPKNHEGDHDNLAGWRNRHVWPNRIKNER